jgi:hypothetical protein
MEKVNPICSFIVHCRKHLHFFTTEVIYGIPGKSFPWIVLEAAAEL